MKSLSKQNLNRIDKSCMLDLLMDFPQQCRAAQDIAKHCKLLFENRDFKNIAFVGLGGSAIGADFVKSYLYFESKLPIAVLREYNLPAYLDDSTLLFAVSYSGNTEETLSAYRQAKEKECVIIAISSDGKLKEKAVNDNITFIEIPKNLPPRLALGYLCIIPLCILAKLGIIDDVNLLINQSVDILEELRDKSLNAGIGQKDNLAKSVALKLYNKFVVTYSASIHFDVCANRFRSQLAENSKALSSAHVFPEMNHNEIVGWQNPQKLFKNFAVIVFKDRDMDARVAKRIEISCEILRKEGIKLIEIFSRGESLLSRMLSLIYIGDFISYYLAILYGVDPTPVDRITYLKKRLAEN